MAEIDRRYLLSMASAALAFASHANSHEAAPKAVPPFAASLTEQMLYSTVRLQFIEPPLLRWGTGFFFNFLQGDNTNVPAIVTNGHVFGNSDKCSVAFHARGDDGKPIPGKSIPAEITNLQSQVIHHPDEDIAILPIAGYINTLLNTGRPPLIVSLYPGLIPTQDIMDSFGAVEDVLTVGYPGMFWDNVNNLPIFHRGITATAPNVDFQGAAKFLVDFATIGGASGSPMFIFNENGWIDNKTHSTMMGQTRLLLIGIVAQVAIQEADGDVVIANAPLGTSGTTGLSRRPRYPATLASVLKPPSSWILNPSWLLAVPRSRSDMLCGQGPRRNTSRCVAAEEMGAVPVHDPSLTVAEDVKTITATREAIISPGTFRALMAALSRMP